MSNSVDNHNPIPDFSDRRDVFKTLHQLGFNLIPSVGQEKKPIVKYAQYRDTPVTDAEYEAWEFHHGKSNRFLLTGRNAGRQEFIVVEADDPGSEDYLNAAVPHTRMMVRARGGKHHRYYKRPQTDDYIPQIIRHVIDGLEWAIDRKADRGYVVAPGSVHESGHYYEWVEPWTQELLDSVPVFDPSWLPHQRQGDDQGEREDFRWEGHDQWASTLRTPLADRIELARRYLDGCPGTAAGDGASNKALLVASKMVWGFGLPYDDAVDLLVEEWADKEGQTGKGGGHLGWSDAQIGHKVKSALEKVEKYPGTPGDKITHSEEAILRVWQASKLEDIFSAKNNLAPASPDSAGEGDTTTDEADDESEPDPVSRYDSEPVPEKPNYDPIIREQFDFLRSKDMEIVGIVPPPERSSQTHFLVDCPCCGIRGSFRYDSKSHARSYCCAGVGNGTWVQGIERILQGRINANFDTKPKNMRDGLLEAMENPQRPYIEDTINFGSVSAIFAPPTGGKSALIREALFSSILGERFLGKFKIRKSHHLYYDGEGGMSTFLELASMTGSDLRSRLRYGDDYDSDWVVSDEDKERKSAIVREAFEQEPRLRELSERLETVPPVALTPDRLRADVQDHRSRHGNVPLVVFIDTFRTYHASMDYDENDNGYITRLIREYAKIAREFGVAVVILHHTKKGSKDSAGAEAFRGACDGIIFYSIEDDSIPNSPRSLDVKRSSRGMSSARPPVLVTLNQEDGRLHILGNKADVIDKEAHATLLRLFPTIETEVRRTAVEKDLKSKAKDWISKALQNDWISLEQLNDVQGKPWNLKLSTRGREILCQSELS